MSEIWCCKKKKKKKPKALTSSLVGKRKWGKIFKRKKSERRERKIKEWEKGTKWYMLRMLMDHQFY